MEIKYQIIGQLSGCDIGVSSGDVLELPADRIINAIRVECCGQDEFIDLPETVALKLAEAIAKAANMKVVPDDK